MSNESCTAIQARRDEVLFLVFGDRENHLSNVPFWSMVGRFGSILVDSSHVLTVKRKLMKLIVHGVIND